MLTRQKLVVGSMILFVAGSATGFASPILSSGSIGRRPSVAQTFVPQGTVLRLRMETALSSKTSSQGDRFKATLVDPVTVQDQLLIPAGSQVEGHLTSVEKARRMSRSGTIAVDFDWLILPDGKTFRVYGQLTPLDPQERAKIKDESRISGGSSGKRSIVFVGGGAGVGAVIGVVAGGGKGAAVGAGVGAVIGAAGVLLSKGYQATVEPGTEFGLELLSRLELSAPTDDPANSDFSSPDLLKQAQQELQTQGYYDGKIDGIYGPQTHRALRDFQLDQRLPVSGQLDEPTAELLGVISRTDSETAGSGRPVKVLSSFAQRLPDNSLRVVMETETPTGGWRLYGTHSLLHDTLHVWARGVPPSGPATQAITHRELEVTANNLPPSVDKVVVHSIEEQWTIDVVTATRTPVRLADAVNRQTQRLLKQYQRALNVQTSGDRVLFDPGRNYTEQELELLFALNNLNRTAKLYADLLLSISDESVQPGGGRLLWEQAQRVDQALQRTRNRELTALARDWAVLKEEIEQLGLAQGVK